MIIPVEWPILLFFSSLIGFAVGTRFSAYSPIVGEYSKRHPEMSGTYFSICNSFANFGSIAGIALTGMIFGMTLNFWSIFLFMAIISNLGLIALMTMDPKDYESK
jgi:MFS family permease